MGDWKFPGGGLAPRETPHEALIREVAEETGYEALEPFRLIGRTIEREPGRDVPGSRFEMESRYYRASVGNDTGSLRLDEYEKDLGFEPAWVDLEVALQANQALIDSGRRDLPPWLERETLVLEVLKRLMDGKPDRGSGESRLPRLP